MEDEEENYDGRVVGGGGDSVSFAHPSSPLSVLLTLLICPSSLKKEKEGGMERKRVQLRPGGRCQTDAQHNFQPDTQSDAQPNAVPGVHQEQRQR